MTVFFLEVATVQLDNLLASSFDFSSRCLRAVNYFREMQVLVLERTVPKKSAWGLDLLVLNTFLSMKDCRQISTQAQMRASSCRLMALAHYPQSSTVRQQNLSQMALQEGEDNPSLSSQFSFNIQLVFVFSIMWYKFSIFSLCTQKSYQWTCWQYSGLRSFKYFWQPYKFILSSIISQQMWLSIWSWSMLKISLYLSFLWNTKTLLIFKFLRDQAQNQSIDIFVRLVSLKNLTSWGKAQQYEMGLNAHIRLRIYRKYSDYDLQSNLRVKNISTNGSLYLGSYMPLKNFQSSKRVTLAIQSGLKMGTEVKLTFYDWKSVLNKNYYSLSLTWSNDILLLALVSYGQNARMSIKESRCYQFFMVYDFSSAMNSLLKSLPILSHSNYSSFCSKSSKFKTCLWLFLEPLLCTLFLCSSSRCQDTNTFCSLLPKQAPIQQTKWLLQKCFQISLQSLQQTYLSLGQFCQQISHFK